MKTYRVTIPIAGHIVFDIEAEDEAAATAAAFNEDAEKGELGWEMLESFNTGNVCHCRALAHAVCWVLAAGLWALLGAIIGCYIAAFQTNPWP